MKHEIIITKDGSSSIYIPELDETYHSKFGAIQEAKHVFIKNGLDLFESDSEISILEIGFGTGLNALITMLEAERRNLNINYVGVEAYPIALDEIAQLNYVEQLEASDKKADFEKMHATNWEEEIAINSNFKLTKRKQFFAEITDVNTYDLIYFDAFGFTVQPELWNEAIFEIIVKK
jgi:tRNA U34 5-methylaminomethyl-2-thiouridine-forming methyltransferase MnmC